MIPILVSSVSNSKKMHFTLGVVIQVLLFVTLGGCFAQSPPDDYLKFKELSIREQHCGFKKLSIDKQIDYYLLDRNREPPDLSFSLDIASQGRAVIPALLKRLREENAEYRQEAIMNIFEDMDRYYVDLKSDKEVISALKEIVAKMKDQNWARMSQESLNAIEQSDELKPVLSPPPCE